jgi:hypothetical protein
LGQPGEFRAECDGAQAEQLDVHHPGLSLERERLHGKLQRFRKDDQFRMVSDEQWLQSQEPFRTGHCGRLRQRRRRGPHLGELLPITLFTSRAAG